MVRTHTVNEIGAFAWANHDGSRWNRETLNPDRAVSLAKELESAVGKDQYRLNVGLLHSSHHTEREIAEVVGKSPSTIHRGIPNTMRLLRIYFLTALITEWLDEYGCCLLSMQTAKTADLNSNGYFVSIPGKRKSMRVRPNRDTLNQLLKRQRELLELADNLDAVNHVPFVACWQDKNVERWCVDFPMNFDDRNTAVAFAQKHNVPSIYHIASGRSESL